MMLYDQGSVVTLSGVLILEEPIIIYIRTTTNDLIFIF